MRKSKLRCCWFDQFLIELDTAGIGQDDRRQRITITSSFRRRIQSGESSRFPMGSPPSRERRVPCILSPHVFPEPPSTHECFALLDDRDASDALPRSRLYTGYIGQLACNQASELPAMLEGMQQALAQGQHAVGLFAYELGEDLQQIGARREPRQPSRVLLFRHCARLSADEVERMAGASRRPAKAGRHRTGARQRHAGRIHRCDRAHPRLHRGRRHLSGQLHLPPAFRRLRFAARRCMRACGSGSRFRMAH